MHPAMSSEVTLNHISKLLLTQFVVEDSLTELLNGKLDRDRASTNMSSYIACDLRQRNI